MVASLDLGRALADRDGVTFRSQGTCMYPTVRPGDVLRIRSCTARDVVLGDIAVCRASAYLFGHRVVETGDRDGRAYIVTRPDRSDSNGNAVTFEDDLLGVVVSIERDGVAVPLQPAGHPWIMERVHGLRLMLIEAKLGWRPCLTSSLLRVQEIDAYQEVARIWFGRVRPQILFIVRVPLNATLGDAIYREFGAERFDPEALWGTRRVDRFILTAVAEGATLAAGTVAAVRDQGGSWRLERPYLRNRYRRTGLDDLLLQKAEAIVARAPRLDAATVEPALELCGEQAEREG